MFGEVMRGTAYEDWGMEMRESGTHEESSRDRQRYLE